ncbi:hypothetical protein CLCR_03701 [Cladophialophora carrionii]|uniref:Uncharacterized protein n=1 Tax=Cladophialophora carrionii TaxID=86049 RepID=A0A1C1CH57_9EURO|nr:hypothetical protein CLCR_03701 [Cladophialophora carrionii]
MALVPKYRVRKRPRRESSDGFSVEEISPDDMGYDGDIEVLHPDQYEEPESEFEDEALKKLWPDTDDELASRLRRLSCERQPKSAHRGDYADDRGRKRLSTEMDDDEDESAALDATEIEISELVDGQAAQPPMKRRRKRSERTPLGQRVVKRQVQEAWTDSSDKSEDAALESPNSPSTPERTTTPSKPRGPDDGDAMEIG